jgi:iron complex outermembrane receptor protein
VLLGAALGLAAPATVSWAQTVEPALRSFSVPAGDLEDALNAFARQAGITLSFDPALVRGKQATALSGSRSVEQGLSALLASHRLAATRTGSGAYAVRAVPAGGETSLPAVTITADAERDGAGGYVAKRSTAGTKTDTAIIETPQSISVVTADQIETIKAQSIMDAVGYVAGIGRAEGQDRTTDTFVIRGFRAFNSGGSVYRDGTRYGVNLYNGQQEPYGLERIEILKGAASVLYGTAAPGGVINTVSKRPTTESLREVNVEFGSFNRKQLSADFGGALTDDGVWSYRLTALKRDSDTAVDHVPDNRGYIAPALKWQPNAATSLTLLAEYQHDLTDYVYALPTQGTILPNVNGRIARDRFVGEPGFNQYDNTRKSIGYLFEHSFNDQLLLRHSLRHYKSDNDFDYLFISGVSANQRTTAFRGALARFDRSSAVTSDTSLQAKWGSAEFAHTTLFGIDYLDQKHESERYRGTAAPLDLYAPVYGAPMGALVQNPAASWKERSHQIGLYLQDQIKINDRWVVLLGGRHDQARYSEGNFFGAPVWTTDNEKTSATTGRAGVVYLADNGLAPFASYSQSFEPTAGRDREDNRFKPTKGEQYEAGLRYQPKGSDTLLSAAVYQLTQRNVSVTDPVDTDYMMQQGTVRSRGLELEAKTRIGHHTNLVAAYAYTDARTLQASPLVPEDEGKRTGGVPYNQFSVWGDYDFGAFGLPGLKAGLGVRYVGGTEALTIAGKVPAFTLVDAMLSYTTGPWRLALNVTNLTDKTYIASCTYGCFYGEPRKVITTATYRW